MGDIKKENKMYLDMVAASNVLLAGDKRRKHFRVYGDNYHIHAYRQTNKERIKFIRVDLYPIGRIVNG